MPEALKAEEVNSKTDPSVSKQFDTETSMAEQVSDLFKLVDAQTACMLTTHRASVGPVGRAMSVAKRQGSHLLFLANKHSHKFEDLQNSREAQVTFQDSKTQDWISLTGSITTVASDDSRIMDCWSKAASAWFGDLGDKVHTGKQDDPRVTLLEFSPSYAVYWKHTQSSMGFMKEIGQAAMQGKVAQTGVLRELHQKDLEWGSQPSGK